MKATPGQPNPELQPEKKTASDKRTVVRQDRHTITDLRCHLEIDGKPYPIINYNSFGIAISTPSALPDNFERTECRVFIEDTELGTIDIRKVREERSVDGTLKTAFEITGTPLNAERMQTFPEIWRIVESVRKDHQRFESLPVKFVANVYQLKENLSRLEKKIEDLQSKQDFLSRAQVEDFEATVIAVTGQAIHDIWKESHTELNDLLKGQPDELVKAAFDFFREQMKGLLYQSPFAQRTFAKPRGYAGDFEMMNLIYRNQDMGMTLFGRCVERSFLICPEPQAVRNRATYVGVHFEKLLKDKPTGKLRILSVASGPAVEVQKLVWRHSKEDLARLDIYLLDQDQGSLKHAQREIRKVAKDAGKDISVTLIHRTIKEVIMGGLDEEPFDLVYSAGLFDYFTDAVAHTAGKALLERVKPGCTLVIGNFDIATPNRFTMSLVFDWNLMYRSEADLKRIFNYPGIKMGIEREEAGVNLFCVLNK